MNTFDLCGNSATLSSQQRDFVNQTLWARLGQVAELYATHQATGNLYLGGSVGLLQPSVLLRNGQTMAVKSDLDLYYLTQKLPLSAQETDFLTAVSRLPDDIEVSVHVMPAVDIDESPLSPAYDDLRRSLARPICQGFPFQAPLKENAYQDKSIVLFAMSMLGAAVVPYYVATHPYANLEGDRIACDASTAVKAADVLLRVPCYKRLGDSYSHRAVIELADSGFYQGVCEAQFVHDVIRRREQVDLEAPPLTVSTYELYHRMMTQHLGLDPSIGELELADAVCQKYLPESGPLDTLHRLQLYVTLWLYTGQQQFLAKLREETHAVHYLPEAVLTLWQDWLSAPEKGKAQTLGAELKGLAMKSITDRLTGIVAAAYSRAQQQSSTDD